MCGATCPSSVLVEHIIQWSEDGTKADNLSRKVMGSTLRALLGVDHSRAGPPRFAQAEALGVGCGCLRGDFPVVCPFCGIESQTSLDRCGHGLSIVDLQFTSTPQLPGMRVACVWNEAVVVRAPMPSPHGWVKLP